MYVCVPRYSLRKNIKENKRTSDDGMFGCSLSLNATELESFVTGKSYICVRYFY